MAQYGGHPWVMRCDVHRECWAVPDVPGEFLAHPSRVFIRTGDGFELSFADLVDCPVKVKINFSGGTARAPGGGGPVCPSCRSELALFNPLLDVLEMLRDINDVGRDLKVLFEPLFGPESELRIGPVVAPPRRVWTSGIPCGWCGAHNPDGWRQKCAGCRVVRYCSRGCQKHHWKEGDHKKMCAWFQRFQGCAA